MMLICCILSLTISLPSFQTFSGRPERLIFQTSSKLEQPNPREQRAQRRGRKTLKQRAQWKEWKTLKMYGLYFDLSPCCLKVQCSGISGADASSSSRTDTEWVPGGKTMSNNIALVVKDGEEFRRRNEVRLIIFMCPHEPTRDSRDEAACRRSFFSRMTFYEFQGEMGAEALIYDR